MFSVKVSQTGVKDVLAKMDSLARAQNDLSPAWPSVVRTFHSVEREQFESEGASGQSGRWPDLAEAYALRKEIQFPGAKILERTGRLRTSLTNTTSDSIVESNPRRLAIGSRVPYAGFHQEEGRVKNWRPPISFTNEQVAKIAATINRYFVAVMRQARNQGFQWWDEE